MDDSQLCTVDKTEIGTTKVDAIGKYGYVYKGIACHLLATPLSDTVPFYRYSFSTFKHFYTTNWDEVDKKKLEVNPQRVNRWTQLLDMFIQKVVLVRALCIGITKLKLINIITRFIRVKCVL